MNNALVLILIFLAMPSVSAIQGHMRLLAAYESENGSYEGIPADLYLEIKKGNGRVFLETYPLTKMDTQISTRFAKEIACNYLDVSCDNHDFFYTIKSDSVIIGGPSAGAAISLLTISLLKNMRLDKDIAITGTINSGAIIGSVGGIKAKVEAARKAGIKKVLIPKGERFLKDDKNNTTIDLKEYALNLSIELKEAADIDEALYEFTGKEKMKPNKSIAIHPEYKETMRYLAERMCNRTEFLSSKRDYSHADDKINSSRIIALNLSNKGNEAFNKKKYYSSASYCFGANIRYSYIDLYMKNLSFEQKNREIYSIKERIKEFNEKINKAKIMTISDLESYAIVKERLKEAEEYLDDAWLEINDTKKAIFNLAYGKERLYSAYSWAFFFDHRGKKFNIEKELIKDSCIKKIAEAEERNQYLSIYYPNVLKDSREEINFAKSDLKNKDYELCLFKASKAKASANTVLSVMGVDEEKIDELIIQKKDIVKNIIAKQINDDIFPIVGYSYYEYADSLKNEDKYSSLLYLEYAMELSNLDMYFKEKSRIYLFDIELRMVYMFLIGILTGILICFIYSITKKRKNNNKKNKK